MRFDAPASSATEANAASFASGEGIVARARAANCRPVAVSSVASSAAISS